METPDGTIITQGYNANDGIVPTGGETFLWTGAFVAREVILVAPAKMNRDEIARYFARLHEYLVCQSLSIPAS